MAIEFIYLDHGPELAFDADLDDVRARVIGSGPANASAAVPTDVIPHGEVRFTYQPGVIAGTSSVAVRLDVFGIQIYSDPLRPDMPVHDIDPPWPSNVWVS